MKIVVLADGSSIHTEKWIHGLMINGEKDLSLISMSANKTRPAILGFLKQENIFHLKSSRIKESGNNFSYITKLYRAYKIIKKLNPEHISTIYLTSYGFIGALIKGGASLSHFLVGSDIMVAPDKSFFHRLITKYALKKSDLLVCASKSISNKVDILKSEKNIKILTQQYGVDDFVLNYPKQCKIYDFVSNRAWVKNSNITYILEIFKNIDANTTAVIIGSDGELEEDILEQIHNLENVKRFSSLPYNENIDKVSKAKFFLSLTTSDGASLSLLEAMALGTIPVVSDIGPNREWITDGYNGFIIKLNDTDSASKKFQEMLTMSDTEINTMAQRNIKTIQEKACLKTNMKKFVDSINNIE